VVNAMPWPLYLQARDLVPTVYILNCTEIKKLVIFYDIILNIEGCAGMKTNIYGALICNKVAPSAYFLIILCNI
jgi:hypothetical protein